MINTWSVEHFKSIYGKTELKIKPLTIFTGANSSGKSTVIQSMLLTAQTIQNSISSKPVILNGHIIKLGTFSDILSFNQESNEIGIGFTLDVSNSIGRRPYFLLNKFQNKNSDKVEISSNFHFSTKGTNNDLTQLHPELQSSLVKMDIINEDKTETNSIEVVKSKKSIKERKKELQLSDHEINEDDGSLMYEVDSNFENINRRFTLVEGREVGAGLVHFLPYKIGVVYDEISEKAKNIVGLLLEPYFFRPRFNIDNLDNELSDSFVSLLLSEVKSIACSAKEDLEESQAQEITNRYKSLVEKFSFEKYYDYIKTLPKKAKKSLESKIKEIELDLIKSLQKGQSEKYQLELTIPPENLEYAVRSIRRFFSNKVKYLGPLRDKPKPVYPHSGTADSKDVGFRGEHTASVLELYKMTEIKYLSPKDMEKGIVKNPRKKPLIEAVLDWLEYMGIVKDVKTIDRGKLGHELKVLVDKGNTFHDLTNVGVGVSQVLPILVLSLLANEGSTLIFEQPELHLHPRVQTRLADFFTSLIRLNKQCIVETHSEYLINRLRYSAVVSNDDSITNNVKIYFVEKENGRSKYKPITINKYGVIEDWPKGFFDEGEDNSAAILKAALNKRKRERKNDD